MIVAPAGDQMLEFAAEAAVCGAKVLVVLSGPAVGGGMSPDREQRLLEIVRGAGMRLIGPNSLGG